MDTLPTSTENELTEMQKEKLDELQAQLITKVMEIVSKVLSDDDIKLLKIYLKGTVKQKEIAKMFNISQPAISYKLFGKSIGKKRTKGIFQILREACNNDETINKIIKEISNIRDYDGE